MPVQIEIAWVNAFVGGVLIGVAVSVMLLWNGKVTGISGILDGVMTAKRGDHGWRVSFLGGLVAGGVVLNLLRPESFSGQLSTPLWTVILAGLLVGFGTVMGSGCTSGHGVCGISRLSLRSILATFVFIMAGVVSVAVFRMMGVMV
jgi:uncharacterized protein